MHCTWRIHVIFAISPISVHVYCICTGLAVLALAILPSLVGVSDALELQKIPKCSLVQILVPNEHYCYRLAWQGNESIGAASII